MNRIYSIIYNHVLDQYQVVSEKTKTRRSKARKVASIILLGTLLVPAWSIDINGVDPAPDATNLDWSVYNFTINLNDAKFGFGNWNIKAQAFFNDPNDENKKIAFQDATTSLTENVRLYSANAVGYLNIPENISFDITGVTNIPASKLVAISIANGKTLTYQSSTPAISERLFYIYPNGSLIIDSQLFPRVNNTDDEASLIIKDFYTSDVNGGGAIYNQQGSLYFGDSVSFINNSAQYAGGAITNRYGIIVFGDNASFINNNSNNPNDPSYGGAFLNFYGMATFGDNAIFKDNITGSSGGAIMNSHGKMTFGSGVLFESNRTTSDGGIGGAIFNQETGSYILFGPNTVFRNNTTEKFGYGAAIHSYTGSMLSFDTGITSDTTLFTGNMTETSNRQNSRANSIHLMSATLNITGAGTFDMRDPMTVETDNNTPTINYGSEGVWKLGGDNHMRVAGSVNINMNKGTMYFYYAGEEVNGNVIDPNAMVEAGSFHNINTLAFASGTTLRAGGGNTLSGKNLTLAPEMTFGFRVTDANLVPDTGTSNAVMKWDFDNITTRPAASNQYSANIIGDFQTAGKYHLLNTTKAGHGIDQNDIQPSITLTYFGHDINTIDRIRDKFTLFVEPQDIYLNTAVLTRGVAYWKNKDKSSDWHVAATNWDVEISGASPEHTFISGDEVVFNDLGLESQSIAINGRGDIFDINGMTVDTATHLTFNGDNLNLINNRQLVKRNSGILAFNNTLTGHVDLQGGQLIIGDSQSNNFAEIVGNVTTHSNTLVGGHGTVTGIVDIAGGASLSPGNSMGTISMGELALRSGSNVILDVSPDGSSDKILVKKLQTKTDVTTGNVTIGDNVNVDVRAAAGEWAPSTSYTFLTSEGMISGAFAGATTNLAFLTPKVITKDQEAILILERNNVPMNRLPEFGMYGFNGLTPNQYATATAIDQLPSYNPVYRAVVSMSAEQARLAYDNLSGELHASTINALFQNSKRYQDGMIGRLHENNKGLWGTGWGYDSHIKGDGNAAKVENKGGGFLLGYDIDLNSEFSVGAAVGFENSKIKIKDSNRQGENKVRSTHFMIYGSADLDVVQLKAGLSYSALRFKANRYINIPTLAGNLHSKYKGHQIHAFIEGSKRFNIVENYDVSPYLNLAYTSIRAKGFVEDGSPAALSANGHTTNRTTLTVGIKNDWYFDTERNWGITADVGLKHHFGDKAISKRFNFVDTNSSFSIYSSEIKRNSAVIGLGLKGTQDNFTVDVGYQGEFNNRVKDHTFGVKVRWVF